MADSEQINLTTLTVDLLSAYVSNNSVRSDDLAGLIQSTHAALAGLDAVQSAPAEPAPVEYVAAVTARKSLASRDHILSMLDGKPYKSLKRHLSSHGLTPAEYRERYKLPASYPMVAPAYSEARREVAKRLGLGRKPAAAVAQKSPVATATTSAVPQGEKAPATKAQTVKAKEPAVARGPAKSGKPATAQAASVAKAASSPKSSPSKPAVARAQASKARLGAPGKSPAKPVKAAAQAKKIVAPVTKPAKPARAKAAAKVAATPAE